MRRITLESDALHLEIDPSIGAVLTDFSWHEPETGQWRPLLRRASGTLDTFNDAACFPLVPWSNRIAGAAFSWGGRRWPLQSNWLDGSAIHGDGVRHPWSILDRAPQSVRLELDARALPGRNWPWPYRAQVRYALQKSTFIAHLRVINESNAPMPVGLGFHPFWNRCIRDTRDAVRVHVPNTGRYPCRSMIPIGPAAPDGISDHLNAGGELGDLELDDVFAGFTGEAELLWPQSALRARYACTGPVSHAVLYSPRSPAHGPETYFCVEPVTLVNDGFNLAARGTTNTGVIELPAGHAADFEWRVAIDTP